MLLTAGDMRRTHDGRQFDSSSGIHQITIPSALSGCRLPLHGAAGSPLALSMTVCSYPLQNTQIKISSKDPFRKKGDRHMLKMGMESNLTNFISTKAVKSVYSITFLTELIKAVVSNRVLVMMGSVTFMMMVVMFLSVLNLVIKLSAKVTVEWLSKQSKGKKKKNTTACHARRCLKSYI